jgi:nitrogen PTS system EIIA component
VHSLSRDFYTLDELARKLNRDRRQLEKMVNRGLVPGRRVAGEWRFNEIEITHWLEQELRRFEDAALAHLEQNQDSEEFETPHPVTELICRETVQVPLDAGTRPSVLTALMEVAGRTWQVWDPAALLKAIREREAVMSTGFESGVAIPHPRNPLPEALGESVVVFGRTVSGIPFGAPRRQLTDMYFLVLARDTATHLQILARLGRMMQLPDFLTTLRAAETSDDAYDVICDADHTVTG